MRLRRRVSSRGGKTRVRVLRCGLAETWRRPRARAAPIASEVRNLVTGNGVVCGRLVRPVASENYGFPSRHPPQSRVAVEAWEHKDGPAALRCARPRNAGAVGGRAQRERLESQERIKRAALPVDRACGSAFARDLRNQFDRGVGARKHRSRERVHEARLRRDRFNCSIGRQIVFLKQRVENLGG